MRKAKKWIAVMLALSMLAGESVTGYATEQQVIVSDFQAENDPIIEDSVEESPQVLFELEDLRDQSTKQYRLSDGTILAAQYGMDIHYETEDGHWEEIDNRFVYESAEDSEDFDGYKTAAGAAEFKFASQVQDGEIFKISQGEYSVGFQMLDSEDAEMSEEAGSNEKMQEPELKVKFTELSDSSITFLKGDILNEEAVPYTMAMVDEEDAAAIVWSDVEAPLPEEADTVLLESVKVDMAVSSVGYGNVLPGVSLQYVLNGSSVKEYILVNEKQDSYSYDFKMNLENLVPESQADGSILLKDAVSGKSVYEIPAGYMTDAAGEISDGVTMTISKENDVWVLKVTADTEWINAEERVFPVQIDPTLNCLLSSSADYHGCYISQANPNTSYVQPQNLMIGYKPEEQQTKSYIQLKNFPNLPKDSVICGAVCYFDVVSFSNAGHPTLYINAQEVASAVSWKQGITWNNQPSLKSKIIDYRAITSAAGPYVGWNITELVKKHYESGNSADKYITFALTAQDGASMDAYNRAKATLCLTRSVAYPVLQVMYRDTKGVEGYYTYQTHGHGNAGISYVGDYNGQMTVVKPVASYESTIFPFGISLVYNSANSNKYFTDDGENIHSKNFTTMKIGLGWKLSLQETVTAKSLQNINSQGQSTQTTWLVYNDGDGTDHYFKETYSGSGIFKDEDGLNLTITKQGSDFIMTDKQDTVKFFKGGYLQTITDATGNIIHIVYNYGTAGSNRIDGAGSNRITSVWIKPYSVEEGKEEKIFSFSYDEYNRLSQIKETYGTTHQITYIASGSNYLLKSIASKSEGHAQADAAGYVTTAKYGYDGNGYLSYIVDAENGRGVYYRYAKSGTGYRVSYWREYSGTAESYTGTEVSLNTSDLRKSVYVDSGADRTFETSDDIITTYLFNSMGQTVNISSKDTNGKILGVTAAAYETNSGTSGKNNRVSNTVSGGILTPNLLNNGSFEKYSQTTASGWNSSISQGAVACRNTAPRTGEMHYNLYNESNAGSQMIYQTVSLEAGKTYTASAYVNTAGMDSIAADGGAFLKILSSNNTQVAKGTVLTHWTDSGIENGWQRLSVTYTPTTSGTYKICIVWHHAKGTLRADDFQLEQSEAAGSFNLVSNGSFENGMTDWTTSGNCMGVTDNSAAQSDRNYISVTGNQGTAVSVSQTIKVGKSSNTTFLLSGWSQGLSVPEIEQTADNTSKRFWGLTAEIKYDDESTELHSLPFNEYVTDWQYASMAVAPKKSGKTIETITVRCCYYNNANTAAFDKISLTEELCQTYHYDSEGNMVSTKSSGNGEETYSYDSTTQNLLTVATEGSGNYTYEYNHSVNKHLPTKVTNDQVSMGITYDSDGQATKTTLTNSMDNTKMESSATYSGGLLRSQTDLTGAATTYSYNAKRENVAVTNAKGKTVESHPDDVWNRTDRTYQANYISANFGYTDGDLTQIARGGYLVSGDGNKKTQNYFFTYDVFGNRTSTSIGNSMLASYCYNTNNGTLSSMTYGPETAPLASVDYSYDQLDRVKNVTYSDINSGTNVTYGYDYSADGALAGIRENGVLKYTAIYDSLGRLIYSAKLDGTSPVLYTSHKYDTSNRIKSQKWQMGNQSFYESYTYNSTDGTLQSVVLSGETLGFSYDNLKQLSKRTSPKLDVAYSYRVRNSSTGLVSNQIASMQYLKHGTSTKLLPTLGYTYDSLGNITVIKETPVSGTTDSTVATYAYDAQNQLTSETLKNRTQNYSYDTYGNIRSKSIDQGAASTECYAFSYENSNWLDQLTKVSYTGSNGSTVTQTLTYDAIGNPLSYFNGKNSWNFTWKNGRQLSTATSGNTVITNSYDADGIREGKTVQTGTTTVQHDYVTLSGKVIRETYGTVTVDYLYDNGGNPYKIIVNDNGTTTTGYYVLNQQGDVIAILDSTGAVAVKYEYDAWGKEINVVKSGSSANTLYGKNALKYRGYYYDADLEMYYLGSRFYDPEICRFVNADGQLNMSANLLGVNQYTYCVNNPVVYVDESGRRPVAGTSLDDETAAERKASFEDVKNTTAKKKPTSNVGAAQPYIYMPGSNDPSSPNCYAYAIGSPVNEQPGAVSGHIPRNWNDVNDVGKSVEADLKAKGYTVRIISSPDAKVYDNEFKIALRVGTQPYAYDRYTGQCYYDYHFMRQTDTGQWAEKHGYGGKSVLWDVGLTPDTIPWTLSGVPYYDSDIIYYAVGK